MIENKMWIQDDCCKGTALLQYTGGGGESEAADGGKKRGRNNI